MNFLKLCGKICECTPLIRIRVAKARVGTLKISLEHANLILNIRKNAMLILQDNEASRVIKLLDLLMQGFGKV